MERDEIPRLLYLYIHSKLYKQTNGSHIMKLKDATTFLSNWKIPKRIRPLVMKELEIIGLTEKIDRITLEIKRPTINLDCPEDYYEMQKKLKIIIEE